MADVFISYSHRDQPFALQLVGALAQREYTPWFDRNDVFPAGEFREDIKAGIEEAGAFIFIMSPDSLNSEECSRELDYAQACEKKLIPLHYRSIDTSRTPEPLKELDWIEDASFDQMLEKLLNALLTDKEDWKQAGRWLRSGSEWNKNCKQNAGLLLHGKELKKAEDWLKKTEQWRLKGIDRRPQPLPLHIQFIHESRRTANRLLLIRLIVLFLFVGLSTGGAFALLYHNPTVVTTLNDSGQGSLRWAVATAPSGSTITFASNLTGQTIVLTGDLVIAGPKHLTLASSGSGKLRISLARNTLLVDAKASLALSNLSLLGGSSNQESLLTNHGTLTLTNSTVSGNTASSGNVASYGGGISNFGTMTLTNSTISGNTAYGGGGIENLGTMTLTNSTISGNTASSRTASSYGGGISNLGTMTLTNSTISGNTASGGGGIFNNQGTMTLTDSTISGNTASPYDGGGISNDQGTMTLTNSTISGNASRYGGGIDNFLSTMTLTNSTISGNTASSYGGGVLNFAGKILLTFCTLYGNQATDGGGGLTTQDDLTTSPLSIGISTTQNTLIAGNSASAQPDVAGDLASLGYNLIQNGSGLHLQSTNLTDIPLSALKIDPSLRLNGSQTTKTHALLPGSPAIGVIPLAACHPTVNGVLITMDQRGIKRPQGSACDIGAYEYVP